MGTILYHPAPVLYLDEPRPEVLSAPLARDEVKAYMRAHVITPRTPGDPTVSKVRTPFVGEAKTYDSPDDPDVQFTFKRCGVAENIRRQNLASKIRYIESDDESGKMISERDFPMGSLQLETILLAMTGWNLIDENSRPVPLNKSTVQSHLSSAEFDFCYRMALAVNPSWGAGADAEEGK